MKKVIEITKKELERKMDNICFKLVSVDEVIEINKYGSLDPACKYSRSYLIELKNSIKNDYEELKRNIPYIIAYDENIGSILVEYPKENDYLVPACYSKCKKKIGDDGIIIAAFGLGVSISHRFLKYLDGYKINLKKIYKEYERYGKEHPYYFLHDTRILKMLMDMYKKAVDVMENIEEVIEEEENRIIKIELP